MNDPIFIVGSPRSGTTLLAAMMGAHSRLSCGPETHFFRWIANADIERLTAPSRWPEEATTFVCSISRTDFSNGGRRTLVDDYHLGQREIRECLAASSPSVGAILSCITGPFMRHAGKTRWVEKTPDHIEHVTDIRRYFPGSPILRMIRDPRDVALSLARVPWGVSSIVEGLLFWKRQDDSSRSFFEADSDSLTVRFEDLITAPEDELKRIAAFVGESFEHSMLNTSATGKIVNSREVAWKAKASQPIDRSRIGVWRREMNSDQNCLAEALLGDRIQHYGYPVTKDFDRLGEVYPSLESVTEYAVSFESIASRGIRFWRISGSEPVLAKIYAGDPAGGHWVNTAHAGRIRATFILMAGIILDLLAGRREVFWLASSREETWGGWVSLVIKRLLNRHRLA